MKHWKCVSCHHEWDGNRMSCDWCGKPGELLSESSPPPYQKIAQKIVNKREEALAKKLRTN